MNNNSSKQILLSVLGVAILVVAVVGVSFAAFTYTKKGTKENIVTTGTIAFEYNEDDENAISITNAMPMTEAQGKALNNDAEKFDFNVKATIQGTTTITYSIAVEKMTVTGGDGQPTQLDDKYVSFNLLETGTAGGEAKAGGTDITKKGYATTEENNKTGCPATVMEILKDATFNSNETRYYTLRMWVNTDYGSEDATGESFATKKQYKVKVNVYAKGSVIGAA